MMTMMIN